MLTVHRSERADRLVEALGDLLLDAPGDPMAPEVVAVPTRGVERWLTQRLSHRLGAAGGEDGVCANVEFPFPGTLVGTATSLACGIDPDTDPWPPSRSVWPLLELVDEHISDPFLAPLAEHLRAGSPDRTRRPAEPGGADGRAGDEGESLRRFATVRHLADLYDRYAVHRPRMVQAWAMAPDADAPGAGRAHGGPHGGANVGPHGDPRSAARDGWQPELWRRLRSRIGLPSPAERLDVAGERLVVEPELLDLPRRISLFGLTRLPASHLLVLEAIAAHRDVHLFLLHPSGRLWDAVEEFAAETSTAELFRRADDPTVSLARNALLRSWGRDAREMQLVLRSHGVTGGEHRPVHGPAAGAHGLAATAHGLAAGEQPERPRLLRLLQDDIRADREPPGPPRQHFEPDARPVLDRDDDTIRVHSCHGRLRQVEVMRDAVLHLLADDPTLEVRDVIVMCPDIESFAPLIHAVFGNQPPGSPTDAPGVEVPEPGPPQLRVRLADRSIRQTNPILSVAARLLDLAGGRLTASEVLDLAGYEPVSRKFRFDEDDLGQLERWVGETGVRWGLDAAHREPWKLERVEANTWQSGLDRLLLGVAMAEEEQRLFAGVLPLDDVSSGSVDLAGRFAEMVERLAAAVDQLQGRKTVASFTSVLADATEWLAVAAPNEQWQHDQMRRVLSDVLGPADAAPPASLLDLAEVRSLLSDRLRGRPTRANFRTGDLTICTLVPMRSVPHRVVGLLGLDDGAFPRHAPQDGDDLLLADPLVGDRDGRSEDRQLLLDALLAATEHLVVTFEGRDPRTNQQRSPCVPIAELLDVVDRTVRSGDDGGEPARRRIVVEHPLQSFDQRNFVPGEVVGEGPFSFDPVGLDGARSLAEPPVGRRPFLAAPLSRPDMPVVQLDSLIRFLEAPVRAFLRERLGWYGSGGADEVKDALPVELDALELWAVGDRLLSARLAGASMADAIAAERGRGLLPPGALGTAGLSDVEAAVEALATAAREARRVGGPAAGSVGGPAAGSVDGPAAGSVEINVRLPGGRVLIGTVPDVYDAEGEEGHESRIVRCLYSNLGPKHRIAAWADFLALSAQRSDSRVVAATIGRSVGHTKGHPRIALVRLDALDGDPSERRARACAALDVLVDLYGRGLSEPLPLYTKTSERYADAVLRDLADPMADCRKVWDQRDFGEALEREHLLVLGQDVRFGDLMVARPRGGEDGPGWGSEPSRFGRLAMRLWAPVLQHERVEYR